MLKALVKQDELPGKHAKKLPIMLWHITHLWKELPHGSQYDKAVLDICIVAFWGLARLSELLYNKELGPVSFASSVLMSDLVFDTESISFASNIYHHQERKDRRTWRPAIHHTEGTESLSLSHRSIKAKAFISNGYHNGPFWVHRKLTPPPYH
jgi:hypothetical protein